MDGAIRNPVPSDDNAGTENLKWLSCTTFLPSGFSLVLGIRWKLVIEVSRVKI